MKKTICFTIDVEPDFGGLIDTDVYYSKRALSRLHSIVKEYGLRITAFSTGKALEDNPDIIQTLSSMEAEVEQHSYWHSVGHGPKLDDIQKGIDTHRRLLGRDPLGYRAPQGIINKDEIHLLESMGILFDSSIYPTYFPGRFNCLKFPTKPFKVKGSSLIEIPFSVIPKVRIPIGLSFVQLIGIGSFIRLLKLFGTPDPLIFDFHLYELGKVASFSMLPVLAKIGYFRSQKLYNDPSYIFEEFVKFALESGYVSEYLCDVYEEFKSKAPIWDWTAD